MNEQVDSVSVSNIMLADIRRQMLDFCFDSMEIVADTVGGGKLLDISYKLKIKGGRMRAESLETRAERSEKKDSVKVKSEYHEEMIVKSPGRWMLSWVWILVILFIIVFIINTHIWHK